MIATNIQLFSSDQFGEIRIAADENNEPLFCLADVCNVIGLSNPTVVANRIDEELKAKLDLGLRNGQQVTFVTEAGLYDVIIRSDSDKVKPFRKWITSEVLPSIRKHGMYVTASAVEKMLSDPETAIKLLSTIKEEREKRRTLETENATMKPKALFADAVAASRRSCLVAELAKDLRQNGVNIGQNRLFAWLRANGYLCSKGEYYNQPTQKAMNLELFETKKTTITKPDGSTLITTTTKVTGKGQIYFVNKFLNFDRVDFGKSDVKRIIERE